MKKFLIYSAIILGLQNSLFVHADDIKQDIKQQETDILSQTEVQAIPKHNKYLAALTKNPYRKIRILSTACAAIGMCYFLDAAVTHAEINSVSGGGWDWLFEDKIKSATHNTRKGAVFSTLANIGFLGADYAQYRELNNKYNNLKQKCAHDENQAAIAKTGLFRKIFNLRTGCAAIACSSFFNRQLELGTVFSTLATIGFSRANRKAYRKLENEYNGLKQKCEQDVLKKA